ncbi:MAG: MBL fold metallo-hydrolase [Ignavibacteria bacterium]|nr:MBL fold metallo-hydrolase [Ignavibacteria bacterium]
MKLTVLTENTAGSIFGAEHGLSYFIEYDGMNILFDTGHSDLFLRNAEKLKIDIAEKADLIVLSHGHWDHGDGLRYISNKTLLTHPDAFIKRFRKNGKTNIGLALIKEELESKFNLITYREPHFISDKIVFLGEIPRLNSFESKTTTFKDEKGEEDFVIDDSALAVIKNNQLIIVSGCAHSGICNICEYAKKVTGINKINSVIGGFHLKFNNKQTAETIEYLKNENPSQIIPSHCTELPALSAFFIEFGINHLKTGNIINF